MSAVNVDEFEKCLEYDGCQSATVRPARARPRNVRAQVRVRERSGTGTGTVRNSVSGLARLGRSRRWRVGDATGVTDLVRRRFVGSSGTS